MPSARGLGALFVGAWELMVVGFDIEPYLLPAPSDDLERVRSTDVGDIWDAMFVAGMNALVGLVVGTLFGIAIELRADAVPDR